MPVGLPSGLPGALASMLAGAGQGNVPQAASLVTADMAASIIGGSPKEVALPGTNPAAGIMSMVAYTNDTGDTLTALVEQLPEAVAAPALQSAIQMAGASGDIQPVSGIGDIAGKVVTDHDATLVFAKGTSIMALYASASGSTGSDLESKLEALAPQLLGKL